MKFNLKLNKNGSLIPEDVLSCFISYLGVKLPKSYKEFLCNFNGGHPTNRTEFNFKNTDDGSVLASFFGLSTKNGDSDSLPWNLTMYQKRIPDNTFPIGNDTFGNLILLSVKGSDYGKVYFWDHELEADPSQGEVPDYSNLTLIADSFEEFINSLKSEEEVNNA